MGLYESRGQLTKAIKNLNFRWMEAKSQWDDTQTRAFEETYLLPLEQDLKNALTAMDHMAIVVQQCHRDCE